MTINQQMFLFAVEEMSFSKAAEKAFVTQQCLSNHIQRLEKTYGVKLFERTPRLSLTEAGEILYRSFIQIRDIEEEMCQKLQVDSKDIYGSIQFGTHLNRARNFVIEPFLQFHDFYPNVQVNVHFVHTANAEKKLTDGELDIMLGANCGALPNIHRELLGEENVIFLCSPQLLHQKLPDWDPSRTSITPWELSQLPVTTTSNLSLMLKNLQHSMLLNNLEMKYIFTIDDSSMQMELCKAGKAIMFCPENYLIGRDLSFGTGTDEELQVLRLENYCDLIPIGLFTCEGKNLPVYAMDFYNLIKSHYLTQIDLVRKSLGPVLAPRTNN